MMLQVALSCLKTMKITAVILAKDEEACIEKVVKGALKKADRVIVVDGHSKDATRKVAEKAGAEVITDGGKGKGDGYRTAIKAVDAEGVIVFLDADGSHDPSDIPALAEPIIKGEADMVIASRWKGGSDDIDASFSSFVRNIGGNMVSVLIAWRYGVQITDALNGYRAIKASLAKELDIKANDFDVEQEMVVKAIKKGWQIVEVPSHEHARGGGKSKLPTYRKFHIFLRRLFIDML